MCSRDGKIASLRQNLRNTGSVKALVATHAGREFEGRGSLTMAGKKLDPL